MVYKTQTGAREIQRSPSVARKEEVVQVFITVDTEHSVGGAIEDPAKEPVGNEKRIFGRIGEKYYGIPLILDIAERFNIPLTFFVDTVSGEYFGRGEMSAASSFLLKRGQDIQLHLHPLFLNLSKRARSARKYDPYLYNYDLGEQMDLVNSGKSFLESLGVSNLVAFRAGGFAANHDTLTALEKTGFLVDSSYNLMALGRVCRLEGIKINDVFEYHKESFWELPITNFVETSYRGLRALKPLDINGVSFPEIRSVLMQAQKKGMQAAVVLMHSFSFVTNSAYNSGKMRPRQRVIKRFYALCKFLEQNKERFEVRSFGSLDKKRLCKMSKNAVNIVPRVPLVWTLARLIHQAQEHIVMR
ncbi:MAG: hypothetical protein JRI36_05440 [Deltaproteobacteria bacterium]|nr:hypothetical protein [Deltaproteobacteria bacterium]